MTDLTQEGRELARMLERNVNEGAEDRELERSKTAHAYQKSLEKMDKAIKEDALIRLELRKERADQIAKQMVRDRTPTANWALRELLTLNYFDATMLDLLHEMLWNEPNLETAKKVAEFKARLCDLASKHYDVQAAAHAQAEKEIDGGTL